LTPRQNARVVDLDHCELRQLNAALHALAPGTEGHWRVMNPKGRHAIAVGLDCRVTVEVEGHAGYYCAGMNKLATVVVHGNAGPGVAENMMSGTVHVKGDASQSAGASGRGGLLLIDGNAAARCGIAMKGLAIIVKGSVGHLSAFMAQKGTLAVLGDTGEALGDSIYEAQLFIRGRVESLGADCVRKEMRDEHRAQLHALLGEAGLAGAVDPGDFTRYGSARALYHFHVDNAAAY
jgi:methylamine---glutamate N-methyltransferase subunit B